MADLLNEIHDGIAYLTMNRPQLRNAMSAEMREQMVEVIQRLEGDDRIRCVVLRGAGEHFMAGGDLKSFQEFTRLPPDDRRRLFVNRIHGGINGLILSLKRLGKPVIASVQGATAGAGVGLALACDLVVASEDAFFTLAYTGIGSGPDGGATWYLPRLVGTKKAMEITLLGDRITATEARDLGLINRVVPVGQLEEETRELAERLGRGPTVAYASIKALLMQSSEASLDEQLRSEAERFGQTVMSDDWVEGVTAFAEKRKPRFSGR